ncbi:glycosyltransferase, partial [Candidatus Uhrbacteria bacterium]|nr:glycosyltransferase [Candidatus Uhrbacteria bacterium]
MRILMIHNRYGATARGGAERVVERLVAAYVTRGHVVEVVHRTTLGFGALGRMPAFLRACWHAMDLVNPVSAWSLARYLRTFRPEVIHTHNPVGCGGLVPWVIRRSGIRWVHTLHDVQLLTPSGILVHDQPATAMERSFVGRACRAIRRHLFGNPTIVTSPSQWLLDCHRTAGFFPHATSAIIGNPIDLTRSRVRRSGAVRKFVFVGQVEGVKGIAVLLEAFRSLSSMFPDVALQVVGDGRLLPILKRIARDVRGAAFRGRLDDAGVRRAIDDADVVVLPSLVAENQPSVILEAFAAGVPVIATRVGGVPELVHDGETGFLV